MRAGVQAFARKQKSTTDQTDGVEEKQESKTEKPADKLQANADEKQAPADKQQSKPDEKQAPADKQAKSDDKQATPSETPKPEAHVEPPKSEGIPAARADAETQPIQARPDPKDLPEIEPPTPRTEPWPDATPPPMKPVEAPRASRSNTIAMPQATDLGKPPEMPSSQAPPPLALGAVEDPTHLPGPKDVPAGDPDDPAPPPGHVPPGDSRSLRRNNEFALVYRVGTCVITRTGVVGTRGTWRVVEYPTSAFASNSYAKECSRFVTEGFSDYRE